MRRSSRLLLLGVPFLALAAGAPPACAQAPEQETLSAELQVKVAVQALPETFRAGATVLGYAPGETELSELRGGDGPYICLAPSPGAEVLRSACYHRSLEPFMARGRELSAQGLEGEERIRKRNEEVEAGLIEMPTGPTSLFQVAASREGMDPETGALRDAQGLVVVYVPWATAGSTGLPDRPVPGLPWLMDAGTPRAHIMFTPDMSLVPRPDERP
jgi:hypothetical protein